MWKLPLLAVGHVLSLRSQKGTPGQVLQSCDLEPQQADTSSLLGAQLGQLLRRGNGLFQASGTKLWRETQVRLFKHVKSTLWNSAH